MARGKTQVRPASKSASRAAPEPTGGPTPPPGFRRLDTPDFDGWWVPETGKSLHCKLMGHFIVEGRDGNNDREVVVGELKAPAKASKGRGDEAEEVMLNEGDMIAIGIKKKLEPVLEYVEHQGEVFIITGQKDRLANGRTMWRFEVHGKGQKSAPPAPTRRVDQSDSEDGAPEGF